MKCTAHPSYNQIRPPKNDCPTCQEMWRRKLSFDHGPFGKIPKRARSRHCTSDESKGDKGRRSMLKRMAERA